MHHWKGLELEIKDFEYRHDLRSSAETIPSQTSNVQTCRVYESSDYY